MIWASWQRFQYDRKCLFSCIYNPQITVSPTSSFSAKFNRKRVKNHPIPWICPLRWDAIWIFSIQLSITVCLSLYMCVAILASSLSVTVYVCCYSCIQFVCRCICVLLFLHPVCLSQYMCVAFLHPVCLSLYMCVAFLHPVCLSQYMCVVFLHPWGTVGVMCSAHFAVYTSGCCRVGKQIV